MDLNQQAARVHEANKRWWCDPATGEPIERNDGEMFMLLVSELAEAMEGARKGLMDDKIPHRLMEEVEMADCLIRLLDWAAGRNIGLYEEDWDNIVHENVGEELLSIVEQVVKLWRSYNHIGSNRHVESLTSYIIHRIIVYCSTRGFDLWGAFEEKMAYNAKREDHTNEARLAPGGKKW